MCDRVDKYDSRRRDTGYFVSTDWAITVALFKEGVEGDGMDDLEGKTTSVTFAVKKSE